MSSVRSLAIALTLLACGAVASAQDAQPVDIHGFGSWTYGRTSHNVYLGGTPEGEFRRTSMSLNLGRRLDDKLSVHTQGEVFEDEDGEHVELSFAFADYRVSDRFSVRVGKVKHPFGMHNEVLAVGTLRPFLDLPQAFYGPVGFASESYAGVGVSANFEPGRWGVFLDGYAGGNVVRKFAAPEVFYAEGDLQDVSGEFEHQSTRNVVGGRAVVETPIHGFSVGTSAYTGTLNEPASNRRTVVAAQAAYRSRLWTLESEIAHEDQVHDERVTGGYALAAYRIAPQWQLAVQYGDLRNTFYGVNDVNTPSLGRHREGAIALSRWFGRSMVLKAEYHLVSGNRFAMPHPEDLVSTIAAGALRTRTHLVQFGSQFSF